MDEIANINRNVQEYGLIDPAAEKMDLYDSFNDVLLRLASLFRRQKSAYEIVYSSPRRADFKLRSDKQFTADVIEQEFDLIEPSENIYIRAEKINRTVLNGLGEELKILAAYFHATSENIWLEPELNFLLAGAFKAELKVEFERWSRYETPFTLIVVKVGDQISWQSVGKELKHQARAGDIIGFIDQNRLAAFFPDRPEGQKLPEKLEQRLKKNYESSDLELQIINIPDDCDDWKNIENKIGFNQGE
jgi:hypothetical protein